VLFKIVNKRKQTLFMTVNADTPRGESTIKDLHNQVRRDELVSVTEVKHEKGKPGPKSGKG